MDVPLGEGTVSFDLPDCEVTVCEPPGHEPVDVREAATAAMTDSRGPPLAEVVDLDDTVAIVVTDVTRATPDDVLLDLLLADLERAGVSREQGTVVVGLGLHRPMSDDEIEESLGEHADLAANHDPDAVVEVGEVEGCPIEINEAVAPADRDLSAGMVEPHQYAGFSGGAKTVVIGAGSESQIGYSHGPEMLARKGVRLGRVADNPIREFLDEAGDLVGVDFCCTVTHGPDGFMGAAAGDPRAVVRDLAGTTREFLSVEVESAYDAAIAGVGAPKDANLYQASRAATYVALGDESPLRAGGRVSGANATSSEEHCESDGGRIVILTRLPEGAGGGTGERRFYDWLSNAASADALYEEMRQGYDAGGPARVRRRTRPRGSRRLGDEQCPSGPRGRLPHALRGGRR